MSENSEVQEETWEGNYRTLSRLLDEKNERLTALEHKLDVTEQEAIAFRDLLQEARAKLEAVEQEYMELFYSVVTKHEGETRHQTALRYIREREHHTTEAVAAQEEPSGPGPAYVDQE